ncbi:hypothetical protein PaG_00432 [Moesziomyces aphidis]|uniref:Uncharacterized protein n=1 Tax=Moesziomyces aphidis TaxID=84754 RepID=W3VU04_MOEAP|nr:hypothetical protein PaG_00432 [Moesziomyces aphidis]
MTSLITLVDRLDCNPSQVAIQALTDSELPAPEVKAYSDVVYHNYRSLGLSLQYESSSSGKAASKCDVHDLRLAAIDVYSARDDKSWTCFPRLPIQVDLLPLDQADKSTSITLDSTGKDLVSSLGEPHRKGGGANDRAGPAAWLEWSLDIQSNGKATPVKLQVELNGTGARGADRWNADRAGSCPWSVINISRK